MGTHKTHNVLHNFVQPTVKCAMHKIQALKSAMGIKTLGCYSSQACHRLSQYSPHTLAAAAVLYSLSEKKYKMLILLKLKSDYSRLLLKKKTILAFGNFCGNKSVNQFLIVRSRFSNICRRIDFFKMQQKQTLISCASLCLKQWFENREKLV